MKVGKIILIESDILKAGRTILIESNIFSFLDNFTKIKQMKFRFFWKRLMKFSPGKKSESASPILAGDSLRTADSSCRSRFFSVSKNRKPLWMNFIFQHQITFVLFKDSLSKTALSDPALNEAAKTLLAHFGGIFTKYPIKSSNGWNDLSWLQSFQCSSVRPSSYHPKQCVNLTFSFR